MLDKVRQSKICLVEGDFNAKDFCVCKIYLAKSRGQVFMTSRDYGITGSELVLEIVRLLT